MANFGPRYVDSYRVMMWDLSWPAPVATYPVISFDTRSGDNGFIHFIEDRAFSEVEASGSPNTAEPLYPGHPELPPAFHINIWVRASQFVWYLDLLRNESPEVFIELDEDPPLIFIQTDNMYASWGHID